jgi:2-isopropylmalate synthase
MMTRIWTYDTTLRDGTQGEGVNFSLDDKLAVTRKLDELGIDYIEGGYPLSNPKDFEYFQRVAEMPLRHARVVAFGMTRRRDVRPEDDPGMQALVDARVPVIAIVGKSWDLHVRDVLRVSDEENLAMIAETVAFAKAAGREVVYDAEHFFDGYRANPQYALETVRAAQEAGAAWVVLCDTNGGNLPETIREVVAAVVAELGVPVGIHCHNDCDVGVANTLAAVDHGATQVQGTINGVGERCGNADLVSVIANLSLKKQGYEIKAAERLEHLTAVSRYVYETGNMNFRRNQPFVGASAFAHKGGMHVHAVARNTAAYEHIDPAVVGNARRVLVSELSGRSNIVAKTTKHRLEQDQELLRRILQQVQDLENEGYQFEAAEASFDILVKKLAGTYQPFFERVNYRVNIETDAREQPVNEATVKIRVHGSGEHTVAEGDGPVNALDAALRKALEPHYPRLGEMHLVDYRVRVIDSRSATAARVRVVIESSDDTEVWGTVGVSENIIEASWQALVDSFEYKLFKDQEGEAAVEQASRPRRAHHADVGATSA